VVEENASERVFFGLFLLLLLLGRTCHHDESLEAVWKVYSSLPRMLFLLFEDEGVTVRLMDEQVASPGRYIVLLHKVSISLKL
jgi:hypothetical protein